MLESSQRRGLFCLFPDLHLRNLARHTPHFPGHFQFAVTVNINHLCLMRSGPPIHFRSLPGLPPPPASDDFVYLVELAVSEICTNIIQHSYLTASGEIRGSLILLENGIQIDLYDDGESFDPNAVPDPSPQPDTLNEGGYGLHIVRQIMDSVQYQADTPRGNHWRLIKYIPSD